MSPFLSAAGIIIFIVGLLWIGQGTGIFPYPSYSFMIGDMVWTWIGAATAAAGLALTYAARRRR